MPAHLQINSKQVLFRANIAQLWSQSKLARHRLALAARPRSMETISSASEGLYDGASDGFWGAWDVLKEVPGSRTRAEHCRGPNIRRCRKSRPIECQ